MPSARLRRFVVPRLQRWLADRYVTHWGKPDLLHAHGSMWGGVAARQVGRKLDIPYVVTEHSSAFDRGLVPRREYDRLRSVFADAHEVLAVSRSLAETIAPFAGGRRIRIVPNLVDTDYFRHPESGRPSSPFRFLLIAWLNPNKRVDLALRAFSMAFGTGSRAVAGQAGPTAVLEIVGDGSERAHLESLAHDLGVSKRVRFLGTLPRPDVREALWRSRALVLSSAVETFGVVLIEAMATGIPVIVTPSGGPEEFVEPEIGVIARDDADGLAAAMRRVYLQREEWSARSRSIREYAVARFGEATVVRSLLDTYEEVLSRYADEPRQPEP